MKYILLLRHAKSSWDDSSLDDFDRPLAKRGLKDAPRMGVFARESGYVPDLIISSPAERARQTTELFCESAEVDKNHLTWNEDLYYGSVSEYLKAIQAAGSGNILMLVGHNPLMEQTVSLLCNKGQNYVACMPTAALVCLEHPATAWEQIRKGTARLKWMVIPKLVKKII